jgi:hypothetical protein
MTLITGNTYPVKDKLKALGGKWDAVNKGWLVPDDKADEAHAIVGGAPKKASNTSSGRSYRQSNRSWAPCGYPGCSPSYCDECDGEGAGGRW